VVLSISIHSCKSWKRREANPLSNWNIMETRKGDVKCKYRCCVAIPMFSNTLYTNLKGRSKVWWKEKERALQGQDIIFLLSRIDFLLRRDGTCRLNCFYETNGHISNLFLTNVCKMFWTTMKLLYHWKGSTDAYLCMYRREEFLSKSNTFVVHVSLVYKGKKGRDD
jgi:hypothetical protein